MFSLFREDIEAKPNGGNVFPLPSSPAKSGRSRESFGQLMKSARDSLLCPAVVSRCGKTIGCPPGPCRPPNQDVRPRASCFLGSKGREVSKKIYFKGRPNVTRYPTTLDGPGRDMERLRVRTSEADASLPPARKICRAHDISSAELVAMISAIGLKEEIIEEEIAENGPLDPLDKTCELIASFAAQSVLLTSVEAERRRFILGHRSCCRHR